MMPPTSALCFHWDVWVFQNHWMLENICNGSVKCKSQSSTKLKNWEALKCYLVLVGQFCADAALGGHQERL